MRHYGIGLLPKLVIILFNGILFYCTEAALFGRSFSDDNFLGFEQRRGNEESSDDVPAGQCAKNSGKSCKAWTNSDIIEHVSQCAGGRYDPLAGIAKPGQPPSALVAQCSANAQVGETVGTCICADGYCADLDMKCHAGTYSVVSDTFTISAKAWGESQHLYMLADGKVKIGIPPDPLAATWRIAVTKSGVKMLYTDRYPTTVLNEYETCTEYMDDYGLTYDKCQLIVGHAANPRADEMGWYLELDFKLHHIDHKNPYVNIRSAHSGSLFYIDPQTLTGRECDETSRNCPGEFGDFHFNPPLFGRNDIQLDRSPGSLPPALAFYMTTVIMAILLTFCLGCVYTKESLIIKLAHPFFTSCGCGWIFQGPEIG
jgi:hypothetical protein